MEASTPAATEGESATESEELATETETETEFDGAPRVLQPARFSPPPLAPKDKYRVKKQTVSQHDLFHRYFRKDTLLLHNIDLFRCVLPLCL